MLLNEADLAWVVSRVIAHHDPDRVYVFGSYAKGTMTPSSDLDLLIVRPTTVPFPYRGHNVAAVLATMPIRFDLLFFTPEEIEAECREPDGFLATIMAHARLLYDRDRPSTRAAARLGERIVGFQRRKRGGKGDVTDIDRLRGEGASRTRT